MPIKTLVGDFHQVLQQSPLLWEAYLGLPDNQRQLVDKTYSELIWERILSEAIIKDHPVKIPPVKKRRNIE